MTDPRELAPAAVLDALGPAFEPDRATFETALAHRRTTLRHGDLPRWHAALARLPAAEVMGTDLDADAPAAALAGVDDAVLTAALRDLSPWRKGPWRIGPVAIDSEWRSDFKWQRLDADRQQTDIRSLEIPLQRGKLQTEQHRRLDSDHHARVIREHAPGVIAVAAADIE